MEDTEILTKTGRKPRPPRPRNPEVLKGLRGGVLKEPDAEIAERIRNRFGRGDHDGRFRLEGQGVPGA